MATIGIITAPAIGHVFPFIYLCKELKKRGHHIVFFNLGDFKDKILKEDFNFCEIGAQFIKKGSMSILQNELGQLTGLKAMEQWQKINNKLTYVICATLPSKIIQEKIDFLLVDQSDASGGSIAEYLKIPYISIVIGNSLTWEESIPPIFTGWQYSEKIINIKRNIIGMKEVTRTFKPLHDTINSFRKKWGLQSFVFKNDLFPVSPIAQIAQMPSFFDLPRKELSSNFSYTGPFKGQMISNFEFPFNRLNGKPIIFVSLGTVVNSRIEIFENISKASSMFDVQLVIALGSNHIPDALLSLPNDAIVVGYAPQFEILKSAKLCITHGGLNTVLDALAHGVPLLAIPISFDQPGTAERIRWHELGDVISVNQVLEPEYLFQKLSNILNNDKYILKCQEFKAKLVALNGVVAASNLIEKLFNI